MNLSSTRFAQGDTDDYCGDPALDTQNRTLTTRSNDFTVTLVGLPGTVVSNEVHSFEIELKAAPGISIDRLGAIVDAGMPQHAHGMTVRPEISRGDVPGRFSVDGLLLHMPGAWELHVDVVDGPYTERVTFHVDAR